MRKSEGGYQGGRATGPPPFPMENRKLYNINHHPYKQFTFCLLSPQDSNKQGAIVHGI